MVIEERTITLSNGVKMPMVGLGTWLTSPAEAKVAVKVAIEAGYRLIDTAAAYDNEGAIGETIKELIQAGKINRGELFITTKVGSTLICGNLMEFHWRTTSLQLWVSHLHPDDVEDALRESLGRLQMDYVDLYLAHAPTCFNHDVTAQNPSVKVQDTWRGLESVYKKGLTKAIGVSNYNCEQIERVLRKATVPIHNCQVELHLYWPQYELHDVCKRKLVWPEAPNDLDDSNVKVLATKYTKTPAQILLRYLIDRNIAVLPKSVNPLRIVENFQVFDFALTMDDIRLLESAGHHKRLFMADFMEGHPEDPFAAERKH
ncbi:Aldo keto reductase domain containing protein [Trichostrongylus colubriformis]|uniref:Aldo keto reductase domain containing protein n=1 Tax=Trichostrongylus colubriformis TaxID=6319 RepID=A0AAN8FMY8_TRICO